MKEMKETKIFILELRKKFHVLLRHEDGSEEVSDKGWPTREECERAIEEYAKSQGGDLHRTQ